MNLSFRGRSIKASRYLFMYTLGGSLMMLVGVMLVYVELGTWDTNVINMVGLSVRNRTDSMAMYVVRFYGEDIWCILVHLWLGEAHVEASNGGFGDISGCFTEAGYLWFCKV